MKKIFLSIYLLLFAFGANAQKNKYLVDEYGNPMHYSIAVRYSKYNIFLVVDSGTKKVTPFEYLNGSHLGNIVLLQKAKSIELESRIQKDSLKFYRYSIIENDSIILKKNAIPERIKYKWGSGSILPNYVAADLGAFNVVDKKLEIKIFRINNEKNTTSVIIYNKPLLAPSSLSFNILGTNSTKNVKNNTNLIVDEKVKGLRIAMKNTDINVLYAIIVENIDAHSTTMLEPRWKPIKTGGIVIGDIDVSEFTKPGKYKISIYPKTHPYAYWKDNTLTKDFLFTVEKPKEK